MVRLNLGTFAASLPKTLPPCVVVDIVSQCPNLNAHEYVRGRHQNGAILPFQESDLFELQFRSRRQLCFGDDVRPAYEIAFYCDPKDGLPFPPGSALGVICPNVRNDVDAMLKLLNFRGDEHIHISSIGTNAKVKARFERSFSYIPKHCSVREILENVLDLRTVLKKAFLKILGDCCPEGSSDRRQLHELSSTNQEAYRSEVLEGRMMIFDLLEKFPTCRPGLAVLVEYLNRLSPRFYSVSNYSVNEIRFIYRPMEFVSQGRVLTGQCSTMLALLQRDASDNLETKLNKLMLDATHSTYSSRSTVMCYLRENVRNFNFPAKPTIHFMFVCHGTGIAPFSAYLQWLRSTPTAKPNAFWLYYGCRYASRDALFDLEAVRESGCRLEVRQSRADASVLGGTMVKRGYVQDALLECTNDVRKHLVTDSGELLICGDFQTMAKDTLAVLGKILGAETVDSLLRQNRIKLDVWT